MSQPVDPWTYLRHQTEQTDRLLRRRARSTERVTVHHRKSVRRD